LLVAESPVENTLRVPLTLLLNAENSSPDSRLPKRRFAGQYPSAAYGCFAPPLVGIGAPQHPD
jgi:hypothetical protein